MSTTVISTEWRGRLGTRPETYARDISRTEMDNQSKIVVDNQNTGRGFLTEVLEFHRVPIDNKPALRSIIKGSSNRLPKDGP